MQFPFSYLWREADGFGRFILVTILLWAFALPYMLTRVILKVLGG